MIQRVFAIPLYLAVLSMASFPLSADEISSYWPESEIKNFIAGCRYSILSNAYADYLRRQGMSEQEVAAQPFGSLPPDQQKSMEAGLEQFLTMCDCFADILKIELPYEEIQKNPDVLMNKQQEIMNSGKCPPPSSW